MPSSAVPNTDLPGPDLPDTETDAGPDDGTPGTSATLLRCDGCGASAVIDQDEHRYGGLVRSFLGQHAGCGNAVQITRAHSGNN
jgi:hypothetical protein